MSLKAQTGDDLYEAMQNLEYDKAETISLNIIKQEIDYKSAKSLIDHSYAHYSLGVIYSYKRHNKFNFSDSYNHLLESKLIIEKGNALNDSKGNKKFAYSLIKQANSQIDFLIKNYPELANNVIPAIVNNSFLEKEKISTSSNFGQKIENVTIVADGSAATKDKALTYALRNAIQKAFGAFISSSIKIENEQLLYDEIAMVAKGSIISYTKIGEIKDSNSNEWSITISAIVSPSKIIEYSKSKGIEVEFKGSVFAQNILIENFYKEQEPLILKNLIESIDFKKLYRYELKIDNPRLHRGVAATNPSDDFRQRLHVTKTQIHDFRITWYEDKITAVESYDGTYYIPIQLILAKTAYFDEVMKQYIQIVSNISITTNVYQGSGYTPEEPLRSYEEQYGSTFTPENSILFISNRIADGINPTFRNPQSARLIENLKLKFQSAYEGEIILPNLKTNLGKMEDYYFLPRAYQGDQFRWETYLDEKMKDSSIILYNVGTLDDLQKITSIKLDL
jgi:hypothetical protein